MAQLCTYFPSCKGCSCQHIDYAFQLQNKKNLAIKSISFNNIEVFSSDEYFYRNRMDFLFHKTGIGLRSKEGTINIEKCVICNEQINKFVAEVNKFFSDLDYFDFKKRTGTFCFCVIRTSSLNSSISFVLNKDSTRIKEAVKKITEFSKICSCENILITYTNFTNPDGTSGDYFIVKGTDFLKETILKKTFNYSVQGFFQNNTKIAEKMNEYCSKILQKYKTENSTLLDLYGGVGVFGINNAEFFKDTIIIDNFKGCIDGAQKNIAENNTKNTKAIVLDGKYLKRLNITNKLFCITDPPRIGMDIETIIELRRLTPGVLIYISCNLEQLKKDLIKFKEYEIKSAAIFDMFPQTNHIECVVELVLK